VRHHQVQAEVRGERREQIEEGQRVRPARNRDDRTPRFREEPGRGKVTAQPSEQFPSHR